MKRFLLSVLVCAIAMPSMASEEGVEIKALASAKPRVLGSDEIRTLLSGKTLVDKNSNDSQRSVQHNPDGTIVGSAILSGSKGFGKRGEARGTWRTDGDKLCWDVEWKTSTEKWCRPVWQVEGRNYLIIGKKDSQRARPFDVE